MFWNKIHTIFLTKIFYYSRYSSLSIKGSDEGGDDTFDNEGGQLPPVEADDDEVFEEGGDGK